MVSHRNYVYEDTLYEGIITRKRMRSMVLRVDINKKLVKVSAPYLTSDATIDRFVTEHLPRLIKRISALPKPETIDGTYIMGKKEDITFSSPKEESAYLKKLALPYLETKVREYENLMGITKPYKIRVRDMKSRYGSHSSQTYTLAFATSLFHYSPFSIDSVIVHELAHHFRHDHGKKFYEVVYRYYPEYKKAHNKLRKHEYE